MSLEVVRQQSVKKEETVRR